MTRTASMKYWIFLQQVIGQGSRKILDLTEHFPSARAFYEAGYEEVARLGILSRGELERYRKTDLDRCQRILDRCCEHNYDVIVPNDKRYPKRLAHLPNPPAVLYVKGEFPDFDDEVAIAMVGTRQCSDNGRKIACELSQRLTAAGALVVSGGAVGIDSSAHIGALRAGGRTVAVLGCGLDFPYLRQNEELREEIAAHGALISEYPPEQAATKYTFPVRNRLISGLCLGTVVVEATRSSGSLITVDHALEQGRDVFVIPGSISDPLYAGSNRLIRDGAKAVLSPLDILEEYNDYYPHRIDLSGCEISVADERDKLEPARPMNRRVNAPASASARAAEVPAPAEPSPVNTEELRQSYPKLSEDARVLFAAFTDARTDSFDLAMEQCPLDRCAAIAALTELEIFGFLSAVPGGRYTVNFIQEVTDVKTGNR